MTDDEPFEKFLQDAAADYRAPRSEVPREAMWEAIHARRTGARATPAAATPAAATPAAATPVVLHPRRSWRWMALAATLLLGVFIGRLAWQGSLPAVAVHTQPAGSALPVITQPAIAPLPLSPGLASSAPPAPPRAPDSRTLAGAGPTTYSLMAAWHLTDVEALLSSYAASPGDARADSVLATWAKSLLSNTRLLLDSPAARDPVRARLLADLEVILVQLVQRSPGGHAEERTSVDRTLNKTQIIPRLRSAVPASLRTGTD